MQSRVAVVLLAHWLKCILLELVKEQYQLISVVCDGISADLIQHFTAELH